MNNAELRSELLAVRDACGELTPHALVGVAADPDHPLHDQFNWDDSSAAHAFRLWQARMLIARVKVTVTPTSRHQVRVRAFASLSSGSNHRRYLTVADVRADPELTAEMMDRIRGDINVLRRKYAAYDDLFQRALEEVLATLDGT